VQTDGTVLYRHYDGSIDNAFSTATTAGGTFIVEGRHESGNIYVKVNNGTDGTTASGTMDLTTGTLKLGYDPSGPGNYFSGKICEIISFNAALTSTQRGHIYNMLNAKYQTTPLYQNHTLQATTLTGPNADDLITTFSTSALKNYWMVSFDSLTSSKRPVSKIYFGTLLDVGRDPVTGRNLSRANNADQTRYAPYQFSMTWQGLTDAVRVSVDTYIGQYAGDHCFILHPTSYTYTVGGYDPIYARIVDYDIKPVALNNNDLSITFEEAR
jgi:hypothetical protein